MSMFCFLQCPLVPYFYSGNFNFVLQALKIMVLDDVNLIGERERDRERETHVQRMTDGERERETDRQRERRDKYTVPVSFIIIADRE